MRFLQCMHSAPTQQYSALAWFRLWRFNFGYRIVASRGTSQTVTLHMNLNSISKIGYEKKSCRNELKCCETLWNPKSTRCWKCQLFIFKKKLVPLKWTNEERKMAKFGISKSFQKTLFFSLIRVTFRQKSN